MHARQEMCARLHECPAPIDGRRSFLVDPHLARITDHAADFARRNGRISLHQLRFEKPFRFFARRKMRRMQPSEHLSNCSQSLSTL